MTEKELDEQWTQQMQNQLVQCGLTAPGRQAGAIIPRLSDEDVQRIAEVVLQMKAIGCSDRRRNPR